MAAIAKRGNPQILWPAGCTGIEELPWDLSVAISHAFTILSWHENRPKDKIPPRWMWPHDNEVDKFFKRVDESDGNTEVEDERAFSDNEYADRFRRR
jgi:hypothetical protein